MNMNIVMSVIGIVMLVLLFGWLLRPRLTRNAMVKSPAPPAPFVPSKTALDLTKPAPVRPPTLRSEIASLMIRSRVAGQPCLEFTVSSMYHLLRDTKTKFTISKKFVGTVLKTMYHEQQASRQRPSTGSARHRRNATTYKLQAI